MRQGEKVITANHTNDFKIIKAIEKSNSLDEIIKVSIGISYPHPLYILFYRLKIIALPCPPPMHRVTRPVLASRLIIS